MSIATWTSLNRNALITAFERGPQQVRPAKLHRMTKSDLRYAMIVALRSADMEPVLAAVCRAEEAAKGRAWALDNLKWCE